MNILLTGGTGFIGRNILESFLNEKYRIFAPTHKELELLDENAVKDYITKNKINSVIHSAIKPGHRNASDFSDLIFTNTKIFFNLVRNKNLFEKFIFLGSGSVYDMRYYLPKMEEDYFDNHVPADNTGFSKYVCSKYIETMKSAVDLRIFGIFGKYEDYSIRFISNMICKALFDLPLTMNQNKKFDYIFIDDLMPILEFFLENDTNYNAYNATPNQSIELVELAKIVLKISGKKLDIIIKKDGLGLEYSGDNRRLTNEFISYKLAPIENTIEKIYQWYFDNIEKLNKNFLLTDK